MWRSWLARFVRDEEAGGSSPLIPTLQKKKKDSNGALLFLGKLVFQLMSVFQFIVQIVQNDAGADCNIQRMFRAGLRYFDADI